MLPAKNGVRPLDASVGTKAGGAVEGAIEWLLLLLRGRFSPCCCRLVAGWKDAACACDLLPGPLLLPAPKVPAKGFVFSTDAEGLVLWPWPLADLLLLLKFRTHLDLLLLLPKFDPPLELLRSSRPLDLLLLLLLLMVDSFNNGALDGRATVLCPWEARESPLPGCPPKLMLLMPPLPLPLLRLSVKVNCVELSSSNGADADVPPFALLCSACTGPVAAVLLSNSLSVEGVLLLRLCTSPCNKSTERPEDNGLPLTIAASEFLVKELPCVEVCEPEANVDEEYAESPTEASLEATSSEISVLC